jgi:hypothetical protein
MCTAQSYYAIRDARHKLSYNAGTWGLYDLALDLREATNRFDDPVLAQVRTSLEAELFALRQLAPFGCFQ